MVTSVLIIQFKGLRVQFNLISQRIISALLFAVLNGLLVFNVSAKTDTHYWASFNPNSLTVIDHQYWQFFLDQYLIQDLGKKDIVRNVGVSRFNYGAVSPDDKNRLKHYIQDLSKADVLNLSRKEQLAYWINLYNALTVSLVVEHYPIKSIRKVKGGFFSFGPWDEELVTVSGKSLSLNDIEHRIIRPIFKDKRIHYAVNCASIGCPNLSASVYTGASVDQQLDDAMCEFINHPRAVRLEAEKLFLSSIFKWYLEDFAGSVDELLPHLASCKQGDERERLESFKPTWRNVIYSYDWNLNDIKP